MICIRRFCITLCSIVYVGSALGQEAVPDAATFELFQSRISGAQTPGLIEKPVYIRHLMYSLTSIGVPPQDAPILEDLQAELLRSTQSAGQRNRSILGELCAEVQTRDPLVGATDVIARLRSVEQEENDALIELYDTAFASLSDAGRRAVDEYLAERILPTLTVVNVDYPGLAVAYPALSLRGIQQGCYAQGLSDEGVRVPQERVEDGSQAETLWPGAESDSSLIP